MGMPFRSLRLIGAFAFLASFLFATEGSALTPFTS